MTNKSNRVTSQLELGRDRARGSLYGRSTGLGLLATAHESTTNLSRNLGRTLICSLGITIAVAAYVVTNGLSTSAQNAVLTSFNVLSATTVEFQGGTSHDPVLTDAGVQRLLRLRGVLAAGLVWDVAGQQPYDVTREPPQLGANGTELSFTAASPSGLQAIGARISSGRAYDYSAEIHHQMVALLGLQAARALGIDSVRGGPAIFVGGIALTVTGIISSAQQNEEVLSNVVVPPYVASLIADGGDERAVIVRTRPGAAQLIGKEGPLALDPYRTQSIVATIPPDPSTLRAKVARSLSELLRLLEVVGVGIGILSISALTILSVTQRRSEIGLVRSLGYRRLDVGRLIALEATVVGLVGGVTGTSLGMLVFVVAARSQQWTPVVSPGILVTAPILGLTTGALAGGLPAYLAMRITPMEALRS